MSNSLSMPSDDYEVQQNLVEELAAISDKIDLVELDIKHLPVYSTEYLDKLQDWDVLNIERMSLERKLIEARQQRIHD